MKSKQRPITVGIDFDGVLAYNPFRVVRAPIVFVKSRVFGISKTQFYIPKRPYEQLLWKILHESSVFPAKGVSLLRQLVAERVIEAHLVTARYSFLNTRLNRWLDRYDLKRVFKSVTINAKDEQPHLYKERIVGERKFDVFIEDNWDVVRHLSSKTSSKIMWIYNITDRNNPYRYKFPYLEKALEDIVKYKEER